jgi:hypothetical protein
MDTTNSASVDTNKPLPRNETGEGYDAKFWKAHAEKLNELLRRKTIQADKLAEALSPFAIACSEAFGVSTIPDDHVWLWKPSNNKRETNGISLAHLKAAQSALKILEGVNK